MSDVPQPVCPHARPVEGSSLGGGGCVCGVMERDQERADPIMEGAPVGVFVRIAEDPSTYFNLCAGQGEPLTDPDQLTERAFGQGHYTGCPIFAAEREWQEVSRRLFEPRKPEETSVAGVGPQEVTEDDVRWVMGDRVL